MKKFWRLSQYVFILIFALSFLPARLISANEPVHDPASDLMISAVNAGFTGNDGVQQNWDFIEIYNTTGEPIKLDTYSLSYTNSSGNVSTHTFSKGALLNAEYFIVGYSGSPQFKEADDDYRYKFNLSASAGTVSLHNNDSLIDEVCWGNSECTGKYAKFATKEDANLSLSRCIVDGVVEICGNINFFEFRDYYPELNFGALLYPPPNDDDDETDSIVDASQSCSGLIFTEIYSYFELDYDEQFIELYNPTDEIVPLGSCSIKYKNKSYEMRGEILPDTFFAYKNPDLKLAKNPSTSNVLELVDIGETSVASLTYSNGQKKLTSSSWFGVDNFGNDIWMQTYAVTPGEENIYQEFKTCPSGKVINPLTGNCINFYEEEPLPDCPAGKFRNPETNRCKSYETLTTILADCQEGYYRNPETNRCKKIATTTSALMPCAEGYERNPETNRCRKIRENNGADYGIEPESHNDTSAFVAYAAIGIIAAGGALYVLLQFRHEIWRFATARFNIKSRARKEDTELKSQ